METSPTSYPLSPVLLVDDDVFSLQVYALHLQKKGMTHLISCQNGKDALEVLASQPVSLVILDLHMPGISGEEVLSVVTTEYPETPVIIITAVDDVEVVVQCMKAGAFDYISKPVDPDRLITTVRRALEFWELRRENISLKARVLNNTLKQPDAFADIITNNAQMHALFTYVESIATTSQPVLITGETGVGKELVARAIHRLSGCTGTWVAVNVAGLDDTTFSDTLFGHKRGAFTGADHVRDGLIEKATNGTLFLDEIGDLPSSSQVKLLRLLQEREYYPLGSDASRPTNARIIVATNKDLLQLQHSGTFRADLYYRLLLHHVEVPPLCDRRDDIPLLVECFLQQAAQEVGKPAAPTPPPELLSLLSTYHFPGNIRELKAMIFDAVSRHESGKLSLDSFEELIHKSPSADDRPLRTAATTLETLYASLDRLPGLKDAEKLLIQEALKRTGGNRTLTAKILGITRQTLHRRLQKDDDLA
ncbi:response regulator [candidate division KSB3 bacterium]|uniref:Response regulator n=1 Tax=candidate division KSB3 bacterium TaxID=2044937 RepID=A0A9D5JV37_9BACT|nr:response regulator [candidate division KSB3 bacterium]MBD3324833.1 response regulator [candidate division KSB3 bacterium]